jgi:hypothetical protein
MRINAIQKEITYSDTTAAEIGKIPAGAYVYDIKVLVTTAFNNGGTDLLDIGTKADDDYFQANLDVSSTGSKTITLGAYALYGTVIDTDAQTTVTATYAGSATAATAGACKVIVFYAFNE